MEAQVILVPYDSGHQDVRMGAGPMRLFQIAVEPWLRTQTAQIHLTRVQSAEPFLAEISTAFHLNRLIAVEVRAAVEAGRFPLVLSGNCNAAIGTVAGLRADPLGVIWFDAHGDFNTPETTTSGFFDGMGLATLAGLCWKNLAASVDRFAPVPGENIIHVGSRDVSDVELANMRRVGVQVCTASEIRSNDLSASLQKQIPKLAERVANVYVHVDLDVLDPADVHANGFSPHGGLSVVMVGEMLRSLKASFQIAALSIASYDPSWDPESRAAGAVSRLLQILDER